MVFEGRDHRLALLRNLPHSHLPIGPTSDDPLVGWIMHPSDRCASSAVGVVDDIQQLAGLWPESPHLAITPATNDLGATHSEREA